MEKKTNDILKKYVENGMMHAELDRFFSKELCDEGYSHMDIQPYRTPVLITLTVVKPHEVMGDAKTRLNCIKSVLMCRFPQLSSGVEIVVEMVKEKNLCPKAQCEYVKSKLIDNIPFRRAVSVVLKSVMAAGAQGVVVIVSGKLKGQRAKSVKSGQGLMIHTGDAKNYYVKEALSVVHLKQGVIGVKVKVMLPHDPEGIRGPQKVMPDKITILDPKECY